MALLAQTRQYFTPISVEFSEDVSGGAKVSRQPYTGTEHIDGT